MLATIKLYFTPCPICGGIVRSQSRSLCDRCADQLFEEICRDLKVHELGGIEALFLMLANSSSRLRLIRFLKSEDIRFLLVPEQWAVIFYKVDRLLQLDWSHCCLVPIPSATHRSHSLRFAQLTCGYLGCDLDSSLLIAEPWASATKELSRWERLTRPPIFTTTGSPKRAKTLILLDDIFTTGATLADARRCLPEVELAISFAHRPFVS